MEEQHLCNKSPSPFHGKRYIQKLESVVYMEYMYANILCNESAFKHGITEEQIRYAVGHYALDIPIEEEMNKNLLIGTDRSTNLLEIMYNEVDGTTINVFHAMKLRRSFYALFNL